jgi:pimeloyl-ACP methyl ester carboxylesterase
MARSKGVFAYSRAAGSEGLRSPDLRTEDDAVMVELKHQLVVVNGATLHVVEAGPASGPPVMLSHGFPDIWYTWRYQIPELADAGYHVICPDQRGYGESECFDTVEAYGIQHLTGDLLGLLDYFGHEQAVFVGHDWGALIVWGIARLHPGRAKAVLAMSVPLFSPPDPPIEHFTKAAGSDYYVVHLQQPGAENDLGRTWGGDLRAMFRQVLVTPPPATPTIGQNPASGSPPASPSSELPPWLSRADLDYYAERFTKTGFFGGAGYYRNLDANWRLMRDIPYDVMTMPIRFMTGTEDFVYNSPWNAVAGISDATPAIDAMAQALPDFRGAVFIEGAAHWNQQENAPDTNAALLAFLDEVSPIDHEA